MTAYFIKEHDEPNDDPDVLMADEGHALAWWTTGDLSGVYDVALEAEGLGHLPLWNDLDDEDRAKVVRTVQAALQAEDTVDGMDNLFRAAAMNGVNQYLDKNDLRESVDDN